MGYTKEEVEKFDKKDKRISRSGIIQALIQSGVFSKEEISKTEYLCDIADKYLDWVWDESKTKVDEEVITYPIPTKKETELINKVWEMMVKLNADKQFNHDKTYQKLHLEIIRKFGKYPTKESSVSIVVDSIPLESII